MRKRGSDMDSKDSRKQQRGSFSPWAVTALVAMLAVVICTGAIWRSEVYKKALEQRERDFNAQVNEEKRKTAEDFEEKYRADRVSYQVMARRIEMEKNKSKAK